MDKRWMLSCLGLLECSVLAWSPALDVPVTCWRGGYSPSQEGGCGQNTSGHWDSLRVNCGHFFANSIRFWGQMGPGRAQRGPGLIFSACLGQLWDNLTIFGFLEPIWSTCSWRLETQGELHQGWLRWMAQSMGYLLGQVVRRLVNVNPGLNVNWSITLSYLKMFFTSNFWCSLRLLQLKTEGQTV